MNSYPPSDICYQPQWLRAASAPSKPEGRGCAGRKNGSRFVFGIGFPRRLCVSAVNIVFLCSVASADVLDRVAVVVGRTVFTESEVLDSLRMTEFINGELPDTSPAKRREAAEHLVDQELLRNEMQVTNFLMPAPAEGDKMLDQFIAARYHGNAAEFHTALARYGITDDELKHQLLWQLALIRFTEFRFRTEIAPQNTGTAERAAPDGTAAPATVDQQMETFLKDARANTKIVLKPEAFQ